jgi:multidrug efflux system membrane fusion protein
MLMRIRKFALAALVLIAGSAVTFDFWPQISSKLETAEKELAQKPSAPAAAPPFAMPVPVTHIVKKTVPVYLEYSARTESIRNITLRLAFPAMSRSSMFPMAPMLLRARCFIRSIREIIRRH